MADLAVVAKALLYAGTITAMGEAVLPAPSRAPGVPGAAGMPSFLSPQRRVVGFGAGAALLLAPLVWLYAQLAALEIPLLEAATLLDSGWGRNWGPLAVGCALTALALFRVPGRFSTPLLWVGVLAVGYSLGGLGHANADERWPLGARLLDAAHVLSMGTWIGALLQALADDGMGNATDSPASPAASFARWQRVSRIATIAAPLALGTGLLSSLRILGPPNPATLLASGYGRLLATKVVMVLITLALGAKHRRRIQAGASPLRQTVRLELGLAVVVVLLTAFLTGSEPPE